LTTGERIAKLRECIGLTQKGFATHLAVSQQHVSQIEKGIREPSEQLLKLICTLFDTTMLWLAAGEGEMFLTPEEILKNIINKLGTQTFTDALRMVMEDNGLVALAPRPGRSADPELDRMINFLVDLWSTGDDKLKTWAMVQFNRAFPQDIEEEVQKKRTENQSKESSG
jgi:transcriptional regulator with XRE-family HTH domain